MKSLAIIILMGLSLLARQTAFTDIQLYQTPTPRQQTPTPDVQEQFREFETSLENRVESRIANALNTIQIATLGLAILGGLSFLFSVFQHFEQRSVQSKLNDVSLQLGGYNIQGAEKVNQILELSQKMLRTRFNEMTGAETAVKQLSRIETQLKELVSEKENTDTHYKNYATVLSQKQLFEFRTNKVKEQLAEFANSFDITYRTWDLDRQETELGIECLYIRGVSAKFTNDYEKVERYLNRVISNPKFSQETSSQKTLILANAYFYLGLNYSNLGDSANALDSLIKARRADDQPSRDNFNLLQMAQVHAMSRDYKTADEQLSVIEQTLSDKKNSGESLLSSELGMLSRAYLWRANIAINSTRHGGLDKALEYAQLAVDTDTSEYYAAITLAQILQKTRGIDNDSKTLYGNSYYRMNSLNRSEEVRMEILRRIGLALSGKESGMASPAEIEQNLKEAERLVSDLPYVGGQQSTVFSLFKKRNIPANEIASEAKSIRDDNWSLGPSTGS